MNPAKQADASFLRELFAQPDAVSLYALHRKLRLSPGQLLLLIDKYSTPNIVISDKRTVQLTSDGRRFVLQNRRKLFLTPRNKPWRKPTHRFNIHETSVETPYVPTKPTWLELRKLLRWY